MQYYQKDIALGSEIVLNIVMSDSEMHANNLLQGLWKQLFLFERQFSRFLPGSELSQFNRSAGIKQPISLEFRAILMATHSISLETKGLYNPFILPALQAAGYDHSLVKGHETDIQDDHSRKSVVGIDRLEIGEDWARIPYGTALDLGGCGKGYVADQLADSIEQAVDGYWFSLGGDIVAGGINEAGRGWEIAIQKAGKDSGANIGTVRLPLSERHAVATSGITARVGTKAGKPWHHLIDPRTRAVAITDVQLVTVCDTSAFRADVLASCAVIVGSKESLKLLKQHGGTAALVQFKNAQDLILENHFGNIIRLDDDTADTL